MAIRKTGAGHEQFEEKFQAKQTKKMDRQTQAEVAIPEAIPAHRATGRQPTSSH